MGSARLAVAAAALTATGPGLIPVASAAPPAARPTICAWLNAHLYASVGLYIPPFVSTNVIVDLTGGGSACVWTAMLTAANCGNAIGDGRLDGGATFTITQAGSVMVFAGGLNGAATVVPDVVGGESCLPGTEGADVFVVDGHATAP